EAEGNLLLTVVTSLCGADTLVRRSCFFLYSAYALVRSSDLCEPNATTTKSIARRSASARNVRQSCERLLLYYVLLRKNSSDFFHIASNLPYAHNANLLREHQMLRAQGSHREEHIEIGNS